MWAPHVIPFLLLPLPSSLSFLFPFDFLFLLPPLVPWQCLSLPPVSGWRSDIGHTSSPPPAESNHLRTAKSSRDGLRTSDKETTPAVLALMTMAMAEAVASKKLGCSRL